MTWATSHLQISRHRLVQFHQGGLLAASWCLPPRDVATTHSSMPYLPSFGEVCKKSDEQPSYQFISNKIHVVSNLPSYNCSLSVLHVCVFSNYCFYTFYLYMTLSVPFKSVLLLWYAWNTCVSCNFFLPYLYVCVIKVCLGIGDGNFQQVGYICLGGELSYGPGTCSKRRNWV